VSPPGGCHPGRSAPPSDATVHLGVTAPKKFTLCYYYYYYFLAHQHKAAGVKIRLGKNFIN